jgi:tyrosyl-tRNA synthetase
VTGYVGYDCTAPSLHVGHLLTIMMLHWLQQTGGRPVVLMGGGTTRVGDPSGRDETRKILSPDDIEANKQSIKSVFSRFVASARRSRCRHGRQCRLAGQAQLHRVSA